MRLLLADDDLDMRDLGAILLRARGWTVDVVADGAAASVALARTTYDLVVLDHDMPHRSGLEIAGDLAASGCTTPVLLWTGWAPTLDADVLARLGLRVLDKSDVRALPDAVAEQLAALRLDGVADGVAG